MRSWLVFLATLWIPVSVQGATIETFQVGAWNGGAYTDTRTGVFSHCAVNALYKSGLSLLFSVDRDAHLFMGLSAPSWRLTVGKEYRFDITIDDGRGIDWAGVAVSETLLRIPMASTESLFNKIRYSQLLTVRAPYGTFRFDLTGSSAALTSTLECALRHREIASGGTNPFEGRANPFDNNPAPPQAAGNDEAFYGEANVALTNMLSSIGATGYRLLPIDKVKSDFKGNHAVWVGTDMAGSVRISPFTGSTEALGAELISSAASECKGKFATGKSPGARNAIKISAACQTEEKLADYEYIVMPRPGGGFYVYLVFSLDNHAANAAAVNRVAELILASVTR